MEEAEYGRGVLDGPGATPLDADEAYRDMVARLYALSRTGTRLGLSRIAQVLVDLGHPEIGRPVVHVAGSNGKGSTCAFLASVLSTSRRRVGLYTSPHLVSLTERIQIVESMVGREIGRLELMQALEAVDAVAPGFGDLTFFEVITAAGLFALQALQSEIDVIEAGLGARLDATRLVPANVAVLTDLSLEHTDYLGDTIEAIAGEEGAVMRPFRPLVCADGPKQAMAVIDRNAASLRVEVHRIGRDIHVVRSSRDRLRFDLGDRTLEGVELSLLGPHQERNALLAVKAALLVDPSLTDDSLRLGLRSASWPGRMEVIETRDPDSRILLDGAHNAQGAEVLARALERDGKRFQGPLHLVFAVMQDKDATSMLHDLAALAETITLTYVNSPRCAQPESLLKLIDISRRPRASVIRSPFDAFEAALACARSDGGWVVVAGSLYLIGALRPHIQRIHG